MIEDNIIVLEYAADAVSYTNAVGHENGRVVTYYTDHKPYSLISLSFNEETFELYAIESRGFMHHLRFNTIYADGIMKNIAVERVFWYPDGLLEGFFNVESIGDFLILAQYTDTRFSSKGLV